MSVADYEEKFAELFKYASNLVRTDEEKPKGSKASFKIPFG